MDILERDILIHRIAAGTVSLPEGEPTSDPDGLAVRIVAYIVDDEAGYNAKGIASIAATVSRQYPEHNLLNLLAQVTQLGQNNPALLRAWVASLGSDDMRHAIAGQFHAAGRAVPAAA